MAEQNFNLVLDCDFDNDNQPTITVKVQDNNGNDLTTADFSDLLENYMSDIFDESNIENSDEIQEDIIPSLEDVKTVLEECIDRVDSTISSANELAANMD